MTTIVVLLTIRSEEAFERFERQAIAIMHKHGGRLDSAFRPDNSNSSQSPRVDEVHILKFPHQEAFERYRADEELLALAALREEAILNTSVHVSVREVDY